MDVPDVAKLPEHSKKWVESCIERGRARAAQTLQTVMINPFQGMSSTDTNTQARIISQQTEDHILGLPTASQSRKRKESQSDAPRKRLKGVEEPAQPRHGILGLASKPDIRKRKQISIESLSKRAQYQDDHVPAATYEYLPGLSSLVRDCTPVISTRLALVSPWVPLPALHGIPENTINGGEANHVEAVMGNAINGNSEQDDLDKELMQYSLLANQAREQGINDATITRMWETGCDLSGRIFRNMGTQAEEGRQAHTWNEYGYRSREATAHSLENAIHITTETGNNQGPGFSSDQLTNGFHESVLRNGFHESVLGNGYHPSFFFSDHRVHSTLPMLPMGQLNGSIDDHQLAGNIYLQDPLDGTYSVGEGSSGYPGPSELFVPAHWDNQGNTEST